MKKFIVITCIAFGVLITACTKLEEEPVGLLSLEAINNADDVESVIAGSYGLLASERAYGRKLSLALLLRSDMALHTAGSTARLEIDNFNISTTNGMISVFWPKLYQVISTTNAAILGADNISLSTEDRNRLVAEARFVRGFSYFHLVRLFGDVPYIDEFVSDSEVVSSVELTPEAEVYQNIIEDFEYASQNLPPDRSSRVRPSSGTALSYLSLVHLTLGNFTEAAGFAQQVIDNEGDYNYGLVPNFVDLFDYEADNTQERVFSIGWVAGIAGEDGSGDDLLGIHMRPNNILNGGFDNIASTPLQSNSFPDSDPRKKISVTDSLLIGQDGDWVLEESDAVSVLIRNGLDGNEFPVILKYQYKGAGAVGGNARSGEFDYHAMRYAEVLLIAAEALIEQNTNLATAAGYINRVRERAGVPDLASSGVSESNQSELRAALREERRLELAYELKRWYDIKRWDIITEAYGPNGLEPKDPVPTAADYYWPRPQIDIDINPNLEN